MSGEASARKKKDRRRKKANIEQLQREEHQEERSRILHIEDDDDDVVFRPSRAQRQEDEETLLESQSKGGSGWCVKLVFLLLLGAVGLAVGVVFLEIDANKDLSSIVADSTAKVSSVLQDTGDAVSSLWNEHGSTVSEIFETVKQSIGLEGAPSEQKAPLEDLADKKENVEETAQLPVEESEEFFDEGEETGLPVEVPAGDVAPEPVKPADTYEEPEATPAADSEEVVEEPVISQEAKVEEAAVPIAQEVEEPVAEDVTEEEEVAESQEEEVVPEIVQDAPEDFVSTPVELQEEAQSVPQEPEEVVQEIVEEAPEDVVSTPVENPEEAQSVPEDSQEVEEAVPEVVEDAPENVVSTPVEVPEEAQSVPEESQEEQEEVVEDVVSAPADSSLEAEAVPEESQEEAQEELVENVVSTPVDSPQEAQSVPEEVFDTHNLAEEVIEAFKEPASEEEADQPEPEVETEPVGSQEEIVEEVVSVPVDESEQAQSVPEEVFQTHAVDEEIVEAADASVEEEAEPEGEVPVQESAEEPVPEVQDDAPEEMVSAPAVEEPEQAQSVPQAVVEEKQEPVQTVYADSYGEPVKDTVSEATLAENEISQEEVDEEEETVDPEKAAYSKIDITNDVDWEIREELDSAEEAISKSALEALAKFEDILRAHPDSPRALYGRAMALDKLADRERSNSRLEQAIFAYRNVLDQEHVVPDALYRLAGTRVVERMKFRGFQGKAIRTQQRLILRFPNDLSLRNELAVIYLTVGHNDAAKELLQDILKQWPNSGFAKVHYGFILKNIDQNMEEGAKYLQEGIDSDEEGALDGRFFYHLGDAYERLGRRADAERIYEEGEKLGLFRSRHQRSLYNVDRLQSKPFWTKEETTYEDFLTKLEENWETIRDEGLSLMNLTPPEGFKDEAESLRDTGDWKQYELFARGRKLPGCAKAPKTCALLESFPPASTCKRGQAKFSVMHPGTHVWAHTGPTNCRLRSHLGLKVPEGVTIRVVNETKSWEEGKVFIFDDSFDHEVWHNGTSFRLVLIVDLWHPDLTESERQTLPAI